MASKVPKLPLGAALASPYPLVKQDLDAESAPRPSSSSSLPATVETSPPSYEAEVRSVAAETVWSNENKFPAAGAFDPIAFLKESVGKPVQVDMYRDICGAFVYVDGIDSSARSTILSSVAGYHDLLDRVGLRRLRRTLSQDELVGGMAMLAEHYNAVALEVSASTVAIERVANRLREHGGTFSGSYAREALSNAVAARCDLQAAFEDLRALVGDEYQVRAIAFPSDLVGSVADRMFRVHERNIRDGKGAIEHTDSMLRGLQAAVEGVAMEDTVRDMQTGQARKMGTSGMYLKMPRWSGLKAIEYMNARGGTEVSVLPGKMLRRLSGSADWRYSADCSWG